jgi:hypothetical protein
MVRPADANNSFATTAGTTFILWGADLRVTNDGVGLPVYQRVTTATDYDTTNFPRYLRFDGTDDCLFTGNIDFTATDKVTVCAGVRKLSDAGGEGILAEISANFGTNAGSFAVRAPRTVGGGQYNFSYNASGVAGYDATVYAAPITNVLSVAYNGSGATQPDKVVPRINQITPSLTLLGVSSGTGNFGTYPLYIGARANASIRFNGRLYQLIGRGVLSNAVALAQTENWVNNKTRAY